MFGGDSGPVWGYSGNLPRLDSYYLSRELQLLFSFSDNKSNYELNLDFKIGKQNSKVSPFINFAVLGKYTNIANAISLDTIYFAMKVGTGLKYQISDESDINIGWQIGYKLYSNIDQRFLNNFYITCIYHL